MKGLGKRGHRGSLKRKLINFFSSHPMQSKIEFKFLSFRIQRIRFWNESNQMKRKNVDGNFLFYSMSLLSSSSLFVFKVRNFLKMNSSARLQREKNHDYSVSTEKKSLFVKFQFFFCFFSSYSQFRELISEQNKRQLQQERKNNIFSKNDSIPLPSPSSI